MAVRREVHQADRRTGAGESNDSLARENIPELDRAVLRADSQGTVAPREGGD